MYLLIAQIIILLVLLALHIQIEVLRVERKKLEKEIKDLKKIIY